MKTLTLWQPWASLVAGGAKTIETRSWGTDYRGPLAIHAAAQIPRSAKLLLDPGSTAHRNRFLEGLDAGGYPNAGWRCGRWLYVNLPLGCIVAICELWDCWQIEVDPNPSDQERAFGNFTPGRYIWMLRDVERILPPVPAKGRQRLWEWNETMQ